MKKCFLLISAAFMGIALFSCKKNSNSPAAISPATYPKAIQATWIYDSSVVVTNSRAKTQTHQRNVFDSTTGTFSATIYSEINSSRKPGVGYNVSYPYYIKMDSLLSFAVTPTNMLSGVI